jgi:hypothetical protein
MQESEVRAGAAEDALADIHKLAKEVASRYGRVVGLEDTHQELMYVRNVVEQIERISRPVGA